MYAWEKISTVIAFGVASTIRRPHACVHTDRERSHSSLWGLGYASTVYGTVIGVPTNMADGPTFLIICEHISCTRTYVHTAHTVGQAGRLLYLSSPNFPPPLGLVAIHLTSFSRRVCPTRVAQ